MGAPRVHTRRQQHRTQHTRSHHPCASCVERHHTPCGSVLHLQVPRQRRAWTSGASLRLSRAGRSGNFPLHAPGPCAATVEQSHQRSRLAELEEPAQRAHAVVSVLQAPGGQRMNASSSKTISAAGVVWYAYIIEVLALTLLSVWMVRRDRESMVGWFEGYQ